MNKAQLIEQLINIIEKQKTDLAQITEELEKLKSATTEHETKKSGKAWRAENGSDYYFVDTNGLILSVLDTYDGSDNYRYFTGNYFRTGEEAESHKRHIMAVGAWNRIANEYQSCNYVIQTAGKIADDLGTIFWSPLRHIVTEENCTEAIDRFKKEGEENGFSIDDLFLYANEVRHA